MNVTRTARERVRAELVRDIKETARRHLAAEGASGLSLRAVARELGMASSAIYRYFPSRDELLTALIIEAYDALGVTAEVADASRPREDLNGRWLAACRAVRRWALDHPHEYALVYGSPVPGYQAPQDTVDPAARTGIVLTGIVRDAQRTGVLAPAAVRPSLPPALAGDADRLRESIMPDLGDDVIAYSLIAWTHLFGTVSFELFGHYDGVIDDRTAAFDHAMACMARLIGLPAEA